jgi:hypothetical protein
MMKWLQRKIFDLMLRHVFKTFVPDDILLMDRTGIFIGGKRISKEKAKQIKMEAREIRSTVLIPLIIQTLRFHAQSQIMYKGIDMRIIDNNRMVLHVVAEFEKIINNLADYDKKVSQPENSVIQ